MQFDIKLATARRDALKQAGENLKKHFVGIDGIIDEVLRQIEPWYVLPEISYRPTIINLWGMTGVGKTDLIRRLVRELKYADRYVELQMDVWAERGWGAKEYLLNLGITPKDSAIILLDEFQRFNTVDEQGKVVRDLACQDVWMLLSDGMVSDETEYRQDVMDMYLSLLYTRDLKEAEENAPKISGSPDAAQGEVAGPRKVHSAYKQCQWEAARMKRRLRLTESVEEIMRWDSDKRMEVLNEAIRTMDSASMESLRYNKLLIFICGNLDEAYTGAKDTSATIDADVLHEYSKSITLQDVKQVLLKKFKPEQVARFGNNHIVYPSLNRASYEAIIDRQIEAMRVRVAGLTGVNCSVTRGVAEAIYRNGVFPAQGVRPVISSVQNILDSAMPELLLHAVAEGVTYMVLDIDVGKQEIIGRYGSKERRIRVALDVDAQRARASDDAKYITAVHECGHALVYSMLNGLAPAQLVNSADQNADGYMTYHGSLGECRGLLLQITTLLGGRAAEAIVLDGKYAGSVGDLRSATAHAASMLRSYGMRDLSRVLSPAADGAAFSVTDLEKDNEKIEAILQKCLADAKRIIMQHLAIYRELVSVLYAKGTMSPREFVDIVACKSSIQLRIKDASHSISDGSSATVRAFLDGGAPIGARKQSDKMDVFREEIKHDYDK